MHSMHFDYLNPDFSLSDWMLEQDRTLATAATQRADEAFDKLIKLNKTTER